MPATMNKYKVTKSSSKKKSKPSTGSAQKRRSVPRQDSPNVIDPRNITSYHPEQADWSIEGLPEILYQLRPIYKEKKSKEPLLMSYPIHGKRLRHILVLPDNISSAVEEFRVETWMRMDRNITLKDLTDRMHPDFRVTENALQQRNVRFRQAFGMLAWGSGNKISRDLEADLLQRMEDLGLDINSNSTRGITPGLIHPELGEDGGRVPIPSTLAKKLGSRLKKARDIIPSPSIEPEALPKEPEATMQESQGIEFAYEFVPYDMYHVHPDGAFPVIRGIIPDEELPTTVHMSDIDLSMGIQQFEPQIVDENESKPLLSNPDRLAWRAPTWTPSSAVSHRGFCNSPCFSEFPEISQEHIDAIPFVFHTPTPSKPQSPTTGIYPIVDPIQLSSNLAQAENEFDAMLREYYIGVRQLTEMPYLPPHQVM
ncbi:hypothetical protein BDW59DRAFT_179840 [Aspergillus cavernicola]|uniref:Uncharacterized protein n=1 Tax=Aspergillus cavernicola TaxID=176166 RepID=A0ABR4ID23_9EURO